MRYFKRGLALLLVTLFMFPAQTTTAESISSQWSQEEAYLGNVQVEKSVAATSSDALPQAPDDDESVKATSSDALSKDPEEEVKFNTGSCEYSIVGYGDFLENKLGDAYFAEDGSYTINIPESNPFFPYEVQFTHDGSVTNEWFMTPDDSVEVGGHTFYVSAYFDNTVMTQMSLEIAGNKVVAYPEKKEFTDGDGTETFSLLPLKRRELSIDVRDYTPVELTRVVVNSIIVGDEALKDTDQVIWAKRGDDDYTISSSSDMIDLSYDTYSGGATWEMIIGENDQIANTNIRYFVTLESQELEDWLIPTVCKVEEDKRTSVQVLKSYYRDSSYSTGRYLHISVPSAEYPDAHLGEYQMEAYIGLRINPNVFENPKYAQIKVYEGEYGSAISLESATEITDQIYDVDVMDVDAGYKIHSGSHDDHFTIVTFDEQGEITGFLPFYIRIRITELNISASLRQKTGNDWTSVCQSYESGDSDRGKMLYMKLDSKYPVDDVYNLTMIYTRDNEDRSTEVTAAYIGHYASISEANEAGAENIRSALFGPPTISGYNADYSKGIYFSIFEGTDYNENQEIYYCYIKTEEILSTPDSSTNVDFLGLNDKNGNHIESYVVKKDEDSYGEYNYLTILVEEDVDLTSLAPQFSMERGMNLYASSSSSPEISGKSLHDFSAGPVEYTAAAEDGIHSKNYWLQVVKVDSDEGWLYINSLADQDAETIEKEGVIYSTREVLLDGLHDELHDILIANMGKHEINSLTAEIISEQVKLNDYWTLKGKHKLPSFSLANGSSNDEVPGLAKIRIEAKYNVEAGEDISGTLTIKSGDTILIVLTLTGTVGDPSITTKDIPPAVKYVPYGTMIQNSNKYSWNRVSYSLEDGELPPGMELRPNGELYGVPTESGEYTFSVRLENNEDSFSDCLKTFTLIVEENTDSNVETATDPGYDLTQRVQDIDVNSTVDQTLVSQGLYEEFADVYLDGIKLQQNVDYTSESGSTKITIRSQTLKGSNKTGTRTLGIEFRNKETNELRRAAQNFKVTDKNQNTGNAGNGGGTSSSGGTNGSNGKKAVATNDPKKGFVDAQKGIITGEGAGYSHWNQDEYGWKLVYADGTIAAGSMIVQTDQTTVEQVLWERVDGFLYAFGADEYLKSGWLFDYQLSNWYCMSVENGMRTGWYSEPQDNCSYYLDLVTGQLVTGWRQIEENWYYFNEVSAKPTWLFDEESGKWFYNTRSKHKPLGSLYHDGKTPDGYSVDAAGVWDGKEK